MGSSTVTVVGPPGGLDTRSVPSTVDARCASPCQARAPGGVGAAPAVVGDAHPKQLLFAVCRL